MPRPTPTVTLDGVDITADTFQGATIRYGRKTVTDQYQPSTLTLTVLTSASSQTWVPGLEVTVYASGVGLAIPWPRFIGTVADVRIGSITTTVTATSNTLGWLARQRVSNWVVNPSGDTPDCVSAIDAINSELIPFPYAFVLDTPYVTLLENIDIGTSSALSAMQTIASWELNSHLYEVPGNTLYFVPYRTQTTPTFSLTDPSIVSSRWETSVSMNGLANICKVDYNVDQTVGFSDFDSVLQYGKFVTSRTMQVDNTADAISGAAAVVTMLGEPYYQVTGFEIDLTNADATETIDLLLAVVGSIIDTSAIAPYLPGLPDLSVVEGWTETIGHSWWRLSLNLSDLYQTLAPEAWNAVTPTLTWATVNPTVTWRSLRTGSI